ncbi:MAG: hypothetical protein ACRDV9_06285 [Acidimicrobiia bacterium]
MKTGTRRLLVVASLVAASAGLPLAASAHDGHDPGEFDLLLGDHAESAQTARANLRIRARLDDVNDWWIEVRSADPAVRPGFGRLAAGPAANSCSGNGGGKDIAVDCSFDTASYPDGAISRNGDYLVRVVAYDDPIPVFAPTQHSAEQRITLVNLPAAPGGVSGTVNGPTAELTLRWERNPEPDVVGYVIDEAFENGSFERVGESPTTTFHRSLPKAGSYKYRIAATRPGEAGKPPVQGPWTTSSKIEFDPSAPAIAPTNEDPSGGPDSGNNIEEPVSPEPTAQRAPAPSVATTPRGSTSSPVTSGAGRTAKAPATRSTSPTAAKAVEPPDPGYSETLPYRKPPAPQVPVLIPGESVVALPAPAPSSETPSEGIPLPPLAVGLMLFVVAMTLVFVMGRPTRPSPAGASDAFSDWSI